MNAPQPDDLAELIDGYRNTALIYSAVKLGIVDMMADADWTAGDVARHCGCHPENTARLLRALCAIGICETAPEDGFRLTARGKRLRSGDASPMAAQAVLAAEQYADSWMRLPYAIRTGEAAFPQVHDRDVWQWRRENPEAGALFAGWLARETQATAQAIVQAYPFAPGSTVADIGGGTGALLSALLSTHASCTGILFEQAATLASAKASSAPSGRLRFVEGDFFGKIGISADRFLLKSVLHDWDDGRCLAILDNIRSALRAGDRLLLIERVLDGACALRPELAMLDIRMMVMHGGRERSLEAYRTLLRKAGLEETAVFPAASGHLIIETKAA